MTVVIGMHIGEDAWTEQVVLGMEKVKGTLMVNLAIRTGAHQGTLMQLG